MKEQLKSLIASIYSGGILYSEAVREFKKQFLTEVLLDCAVNQCRAAQVLRLHRNTLSAAIDEFDIDLFDLHCQLGHSSYLKKRAQRIRQAELKEMRA